MKISRRGFIEMTGASALAASTVSAAVSSVLYDNAQAATQCGPFALPPNANRPKFRWWWPGGYITPEQIEKEVNAMADAGFGGFEIADVRDGLTVPMDPKVYGWGTERWIAGVERALEVADRRGLKADITIGAHWPTGMPGVTPDDPAAAKELVHAETIARGGQRFSGPLPQATSQPTGARQHTTPPKVTPMLVALQAYRESGRDGSTVVLDPASRIDLTSQVKNGAIEWIAPADGVWRLLAFWMRGTAQIQNMFGRGSKTSMLSDPIPFVVDVYGKAGAQVCIDYWEKHLLPVRTRALMKRIGGNFFEDSLELNAVKEWSPDLPAEFKQKRGYDMLPYLPLMAVASAASGESPAAFGPRRVEAPYALASIERERFETDLQKTLTEMYALNRIKALGDWAAKLGMGLRAQCSGLAASYCTVPEGDNGDNIESFSAKAAARDIGGHRILSDEAATFVGGQSGVANWRLLIFMLQRDFAGGVNQVVLHGFSYADSPDAVWPGFSAFGRVIGEDWGPRSPQWELAGDASAYIGRLQGILQSGRSQADVAVLGNSAGREGVAAVAGRSGTSFGDQLRYAGYTRHHITADLLTHPNAIVRNGKLAPKGAGYHALLVTQSRTMELATAHQLVKYAKGKLPIILIGDLPDDVPGLKDIEQHKEELRVALAELVKSRYVTRVSNDAAAIAALRTVGVEPSLGFSKQSRVLGLVRNDTKTDYFYFLNDTDAANSLTLSLKGKGKPVRINLWDGSVEPVAVYTVNNGRFDIPMSFNPNEAVVLALTKDSKLCDAAPNIQAINGQGLSVIDGRLSVLATQPSKYSAMLANGITATATVGTVAVARELSDWSLSVEDWQPGNTATDTKKVIHTLNLSKLAAWTELPNLAEASGIGRYTTTVRLDQNWSSDQGAYLDLGRVGGTFRVYVNGQQLPPANQFTARVDIGSYLKAGDNRIEVVVATPLNNRLKAINAGVAFSQPGGFQMAGSTFSSEWQPPTNADPMQEPKAEYLGSPVQAPAQPGAMAGPRMSAGAGDPGGPRSQQDYGLIGPVRLVPYRTAVLS